MSLNDLVLLSEMEAITHPVRDYFGMLSTAYLIGVKAHHGIDCALDHFLWTECSGGGELNPACVIAFAVYSATHLKYYHSYVSSYSVSIISHCWEPVMSFVF